MRAKLSFWIFFLLCIYPLLALFSQTNKFEERWRWTQFTNENGLPSNAIVSIVETPEGTTWANTSEGLAWYNGYYWVKIDSNKGLQLQKMATLVADEKDNILVIDRGGRIHYGNNNGFQPVKIIIDGKEAPVNSIARYSRGRFLYLSNHSLIIGDTQRFEKFKLPKELTGKKILNVWNSDDGSIWLNTSSGLYLYENNHWILKLPAAKIDRSITLLRENINGYGLAYIANPPNEIGLWEWDLGTPPRKIMAEGIETILSLDVNARNERIILKEPDIIKINRGDGVYKTLPLIPEIRNVLTVRFRKNGDIWLGTANGLYLFSFTSSRWSALKFPSLDERNKINELIYTTDGAIWAATGGGVVIYRKDGSLKSVKSIGEQAIGPVTGLVEDNDGNVWISSGYAFDGAYKWDGTTWTHYGLSDGLDAGSIHKIEKDSQGRLWFLGLYRKDFDIRDVEYEPGPYLYEKNTFIAWGHDHGLPAARYYAFGEGPDGSLWFGSSEGIIRWRADSNKQGNGSVKYWTVENGSLMSGRVFTLAVDKSNSLWFGDRWSGLGYLKNDTVGYLTVTDGLVSNDVWSISIDASDRLWIGTHGGLSLYDSGVFSSFKQEEGLENIKIWPVLPLAKKVYIGTLGSGIQILNLQDVVLNYPQVVHLPPMIEKQNAFIKWNVFSFWGAQPLNSIETRLKIDDGQWSAWNRQRGIMLNDLTVGEHKVSIQVKNMLGAIDTTLTIINFAVPAPFYMRAEFLVPILILSASLIVLGTAYVSKKRRSDFALRRSEQRYHSLFETANDAIMIIDPQKKTILEVNSKACEIYGYTKAEFASMRYMHLMGNKTEKEENELELMRENEPKIFEATYSTKSGHLLYMHINASIAEFNGKKVILTLHRDISVLRQAEAKIRLLAQTITSAQDYISITALDNIILYVNESFARGHGYTEQELIGKDISVIHSPHTPKEIIEQLSDTKVNGNWNGEILHRRKDGTDFPVEVWSAVVHGEQSDPVAIVNVSRDVTERKKYETDRENLILELQSALTEVKTLSGLLPICSNCKKIRDDHGYWIQVETYISKHSDATFTHGLCPECLKQYYPEVYKRLKTKNQHE